MKHEILVNAILSEINLFDESDLVQLNNIYCDCINNPDSIIFCNDDEFFEMLNWSGLRVAQAIHFGDYNYSHDWVTFDGYGNLQSYGIFTIDNLCDYPKTIAEYIADNFTDFTDLFSDDIFNLINSEDEQEA